MRHTKTGFRDDSIQSHASPRVPAKAQTTVQSIQGLNVAFLIYAENGGVLWGIQIKTDDGGFLFEGRIIGCHITLQSMWLQIRLLPDTPDQVLADLHEGRHLTQRPMGGTIRWRLSRPFQHLGPQLRVSFCGGGPGMDVAKPRTPSGS